MQNNEIPPDVEGTQAPHDSVARASPDVETQVWRWCWTTTGQCPPPAVTTIWTIALVMKVETKGRTQTSDLYPALKMSARPIGCGYIYIYSSRWH